MTDAARPTSTAIPWHVDTPPIRRWAAAMEEAGKGAEVAERIGWWDEMVEKHGVVSTTIDGFVGTIRLSYPPKANAYVPPMYKLFVEALGELERDESVRVIVITGVGDVFSTGGYVGHDSFYAGLDAGEDGETPEPMRRTFVEMFQPMAQRVYNCEKPTIAMINGRVMAEAIDLALAADIRTVAEEAELWFSFAFTGNTAYTGCAWLLPRLVGQSRATQLLLCADRISGSDAKEIGLASVVAPRSELAQETQAVADRLSSLPPITLRLIKKEIHRGLEIASFDTNLDFTSMIEPIVQATADHMDAENAVIEKRAPVVRWR